MPSTTLVPVLSVLLASAALPQDQPAAPGVELVDAFPAQGKFQRPVYLDHDPSDPDHYYLLQQTGTIFRIPRDGDGDRREVFAKLDDRILHPSNGGHNEEGLLGFAFDPGYATNGFVYLYYSEKTGDGERQRGRRTVNRQSVVARFDVVRDEGGDGDDGGGGKPDGNGRPRIDPDSELRILTVTEPWGNHNGGTIVFGPDRMLYIALGDGGAADDRGGNGQNKSTLLAAILRIDVRGATAEQPYRVPEDNPFVGEQGARGEIWAFGLRNPWRISFDRETGDLWCGDVGQNLYEEVDRVVRGGNHGWPLMEATHPFRPDGPVEDLVAPIAEYPRSEGISVTGGYVYRGARIPALVGRFVYGDYQTRKIWAVRPDGDVVEIGTAPGPIASFAEEPDGELLALCFDGHVYRLVP